MRCRKRPSQEGWIASMRTCGIPRLIDAVLPPFRSLFTAPQYVHFRHYVAGLVLARGERTVLGISRLYLNSCEQSRITRFLADRRWSRRRLAHQRCDLVAALASEETAAPNYVIIDDTVLERSGLQGTGYHYSGRKPRRRVHGHCVVTSHFVRGGLSLPLDLRLFEKHPWPHRTKTQLAEELIVHARLGRTTGRTIFLADSWYFRRRIVEAARRRGWDWVLSVRSDRIAWLNGRVGPVRDILDKHAVRDAVDCSIPGIGPVRLVAWRMRSSHRKIRCLATNRQDWSAERVVAHYARRNHIETFYWACKQYLGFGEYRVRSALAAVSHWHLVFCAYVALVTLDRARPPSVRERTLGRTCEWVVEQTFLENMERAYQHGRSGMGWPLGRCAETPAPYLRAADIGA